MKNQKGYIVLLSVILLSIVGATVAGSLILLGLSHSQNSFAITQSVQANALATACSETALDSLRQDDTYSGSQTIVLSSGDCNIAAIEFNSPVYTIKITGTSGNITRKVLIQAQRQTSPQPKMVIDSWLEVGDF